MFSSPVEVVEHLIEPVLVHPTHLTLLSPKYHDFHSIVSIIHAQHLKGQRNLFASMFQLSSGTSSASVLKFLLGSILGPGYAPRAALRAGRGTGGMQCQVWREKMTQRLHITHLEEEEEKS